jgi:hypothetical protein
MSTAQPSVKPHSNSVGLITTSADTVMATASHTALDPITHQHSTRRSHHHEHSPRLVLIDDEDWDSLVQWAAGMRRRGAHVTLIAPPGRQRRAKVRDRLVSDSTIYTDLTSSDYVGPLIDTLNHHGPYDDVMCNDRVAAALAADSRASHLPLHAKVTRLESGADLFDKLKVNTAVAAAGVAIPEQALLTKDTIDRAIAITGLPAVVKAATSSGGVSVRKVETVADIETAIDELADRCGTLFLQRFAHGPVRRVSGVARDGAAVQITGYYTTPSGRPERRGPNRFPGCWIWGARS